MHGSWKKYSFAINSIIRPRHYKSIIFYQKLKNRKIILFTPRWLLGESSRLGLNWLKMVHSDRLIMLQIPSFNSMISLYKAHYSSSLHPLHAFHPPQCLSFCNPTPPLSFTPSASVIWIHLIILSFPIIFTFPDPVAPPPSPTNYACLAPISGFPSFSHATVHHETSINFLKASFPIYLFFSLSNWNVVSIPHIC